MRIDFLQRLAKSGIPNGSWWYVNRIYGSVHVYDTPDNDMDKARPTIRLAIDAAMLSERSK
jgi:hypothetical protein